MNYSSQLANAKGRCNLVSEATYDTLLNLWLNDGQRDITNRFLWEFLKSYQDLPTVALTETYALAQEGVVYNVTDRTNFRPVKFIHEIDFDRGYPQATATGVPYLYRMSGYTQASPSSLSVPNISLYPIPSATYTVRVRFYQRLADLVNATDVSFLPDGFHILMVNLYRAEPADHIDVVRSADDPSRTDVVPFPPSYGAVSSW